MIICDCFIYKKCRKLNFYHVKVKLSSFTKCSLLYSTICTFLKLMCTEIIISFID